jgi:hypothetical protein
MFEWAEKVIYALKQNRIYIKLSSYLTENNTVCCDQKHYSA